MYLKPAQEVWHELWEDAGSRGLDTWYTLEGREFGQTGGYPVEADKDEPNSHSGGS